jgi:hypothetical protein
VAIIKYSHAIGGEPGFESDEKRTFALTNSGDQSTMPGDPRW